MPALLIRRLSFALLIILGAALTMWIVIFELAQPLSMDQGIFAWAGHILSHGGILYRDTWDHKGPIPFYGAALVELIVGHTPWGLRAFDLVWQGAAALLVYALLRKLGARPATLVIAVLMYAAWYVALEFGDSAQPDIWAGVLLACCALLLISRPHARLTLLMCGMLVGMCCLIKITFGLFLLMPAIYVQRSSVQHELRDLANIGLGWLIPMLGSILFFGAHGLLRDYYVASIGYNLDVYGAVQSFSWPMRGWMLIDTLFASKRFLIPSILAMYGLVQLSRKDRQQALLLTTWLLGTLAHVLIQGKMVWLYHWLPMYPALAVAAGFGVEQLIVRFTTRTHSQSVMTVLLTSLAAITLMGPLIPASRTIVPWTVHALRGTVHGPFDNATYGVWGKNESSVAAVSSYIARHTTRGTYVLWGSSWILGNYLSNRPTPTRFMESRPYLDKPSSLYSRHFLDEYFTALTMHPPAYVVEGSATTCRTDAYEARYCLEHFPQMRAWLTQCYSIERRVAAFDIWRRNAVCKEAKDTSQPTAHS